MLDNPVARLSDTAMILAAGFGTRMRPLTLNVPKPLLKVGGRTMLDAALDHLKAAGVEHVVVNSHYLGDQVEAHLAARTDMKLIASPEVAILDTGGGVKNALPHFGGKPFFVLSGDLPWQDGAHPALLRMAEAWDETRMDLLLLLMPTQKAKGFETKGDFFMDEVGRVWRAGTAPPRPYVWISAMIVSPALYDEIAETTFSNNKIFDMAEARRRLFGLEHDGTCFHVGTPEDLAEANRLLENGQGWG